MEGPDIDLANLAGFSDDDPVGERAWDSANWKLILGVCFSAEVLDEADIDGVGEDQREEADWIPGMSDTTYIVRVSDPAAFVQGLHAAFTLATRDPKQLE